jgi:hypothetical protein
MKILQVGAELLHTDRQTDMTKLIAAIRNVENAPKKHAFLRCMKFRQYFQPFALECITFVGCL